MATPAYVPIVKSKQSEMLALQHLDNSIKHRILPLIDLTAPNKEKDKADAIKYIEKNIKGLTRYLKGFPVVMLDSSEIDTSIRIAKGHHPLQMAASLLQDAEIEVIPVVGLSRDASHIDAVKKIVEKGKEKVASVRLDDYDLDTPNDSAMKLIELIRGALRGYQIYLLYDFRYVFGKDAVALASRAAAVTSKLNDIQPIATIVAGCGIPEKMVQAVPSRSAGYIPRDEIEIWLQYQRTVTSGHPVIPGDYTTVTPDHVELDWRIIRKTAGPKIVYALENQWFVIRGGAFESHPLGHAQYFELAKSVTRLPEYPGGMFSYGDQYISEKSRKQGNCGSAGTWITACVNRHITQTVHTLEGVVNP